MGWFVVWVRLSETTRKVRKDLRWAYWPDKEAAEKHRNAVLHRDGVVSVAMFELGPDGMLEIPGMALWGKSAKPRLI